MSNGDDEDVLGAIIGIGSAIFLGLLGAAIIDSFSQPKCPNCNNLVKKNATHCSNCHYSLRWY